MAEQPSSLRVKIPFKLLNLINNSGGQGTVYLAARTDIKKNSESKNIAVKKIPLDLDKEKSAKEVQFLDLQMCKILPLQHTNIVQHFGTQVIGGLTKLELPSYIILMEYFSGGTLSKAAQFTLSPALLQRWTKQILQGLQYLHEQGMIHRDIKGDNILLSSPDFEVCQMKIVDFGDVKGLMNKNETQLKEVSHTKGTTHFMSPEMIKAYTTDVNIGRKTDIWSFGCVVIQMVTGKNPTFTLTRTDGTKRAVVKEEHVMHFIFNGGGPDIPLNMNPELEAFVRCCLHLEPKERKSAIKLLCDTLFMTENVHCWSYPRVELELTNK